MFYSDDLIEEIRSRNDIVDVISSYVKLTKKGSTYFGLCPFHNEKTPSMRIYDKDFHCFGCQEHGDIVSFVQKLFNLSFPETLRRILQ